MLPGEAGVRVSTWIECGKGPLRGPPGRFPSAPARRHVVPDAPSEGPETDEMRRRHPLDAEVRDDRRGAAQQAPPGGGAGVEDEGPRVGRRVERLRGGTVEGQGPDEGGRQAVRERGPVRAAVP